MAAMCGFSRPGVLLCFAINPEKCVFIERENMQDLGFCSGPYAANGVRNAKNELSELHMNTPQSAFSIPSPVKPPPHGPIGRNLGLGTLAREPLCKPTVQLKMDAEDDLLEKYVQLGKRFVALSTDWHNAQQETLSFKNENWRLQRDLQMLKDQSNVDKQWKTTVEEITKDNAVLQNELAELKSKYAELESTNKVLATAVQALQTQEQDQEVMDVLDVLDGSMQNTGHCVQCGVIVHSPNYSGGTDTIRCFDCRPSNYDRGRVCCKMYCRTIASQNSRGPKAYCDRHLFQY